MGGGSYIGTQGALSITLIRLIVHDIMLYTMYLDTLNFPKQNDYTDLHQHTVKVLGKDSIVVLEKDKRILDDTLFYGGLQAVKHGNWTRLVVGYARR